LSRALDLFGFIMHTIIKLVVSQLVEFSQDPTQSNQIVGIRYQISPFNSSPNIQIMQEPVQIAHQSINI